MEAEDWDTGKPVVIALDPTQTPMEVAEALYKRASKLRRAVDAVEPLLTASQQELEYLESVSVSSKTGGTCAGKGGLVLGRCSYRSRHALHRAAQKWQTCRLCVAGSKHTVKTDPLSSACIHLLRMGSHTSCHCLVQVEQELAQMPPGGSEQELLVLRQVQVR